MSGFQLVLRQRLDFSPNRRRKVQVLVYNLVSSLKDRGKLLVSSDSGREEAESKTHLRKVISVDGHVHFWNVSKCRTRRNQSRQDNKESRDDLDKRISSKQHENEFQVSFNSW